MVLIHFVLGGVLFCFFIFLGGVLVIAINTLCVLILSVLLLPRLMMEAVTFSL